MTNYELLILFVSDIPSDNEVHMLMLVTIYF